MSRIDDPQGQQGSTTSAIRDKATEMGQSLRDMGSQVRDTAQQQYEQLRQSATEYYEQGREKAQEWEQNLESYVREQPIKSLLIAAGVGLVVGFIWRRI
jgi:ElaB/YqjD/DUF883 family membrane-anchored ribosome-binding protein